MSATRQLKNLGILLPAPPAPIASYTPCVQVGDLVFVSGQGPIIDGQQMYTGKVGAEVSKKEAQQAAKLCTLNLLAQLHQFLGDLDRIEQIVHIKGFVASDDNFTQQPEVMNGASDLLVEVFGESGVHTRCALGTNVLPTNIPVEVEMIVKLQSEETK